MSNSPSMLDEIADPTAPKLYTCKCCKFSFRKLDAFKEHLQKMITMLSEQLADAEKTK